MFCGRCGSPIEDGSSFCGRCGARVDASGNDEQDQSDPVAGSAAGQDMWAAEGGEPESRRNRGGRRPRHVVAMLLSAAVVLVAAVVGLLAWQNVQRDEAEARAEAEQAAYEEAHQKVTVDIVIVADGWDEKASPVPVHVEGTDLDGNPVSETLCLTPSACTVELMRGTYTFTAIGSPVTSGGGIFEYPSDGITVTIGDGDVSTDPSQNVSSGTGTASGSTSQTSASGATASASMATGDAPTFRLTPIAFDDVTDEQLQTISDWMSQVGIDSTVATGFVDSARNARDTRLAQIAEEQAAAEAAQEEAERQAAIDANPTSANVADRPTITITGTVEKRTSIGEMGWNGAFYLIKLERPISFYGSGSSMSLNLIQVAHSMKSVIDIDKGDTDPSDSEWDERVGKTITVSGKVTLGQTAHYWTDVALIDTSVIRVF